MAAPAGALIWILANVSFGDSSLLAFFIHCFDPFAKWFGLDGTILVALILGFPANEIVMPIILMAYMATGELVDVSSMTELHQILLQNGWTMTTAICMMLIFLIHFPCSTTCLTIYKETKSVKWTLLAIAIPTTIGLGMCFVVNLIATGIGI